MIQAPPTLHADVRRDALVQLGKTLKQRGYQFTTVSPSTHQRVASRPAADSEDSLTAAFGWSRPFGHGALPEELIALLDHADALHQAEGAMSSLVRASTLERQLYFHSAYPTLAHDAVFFGPDTYRFVRALQQTLASKAMTVNRAADIGCGAGPAGITVALRYPYATVIAVDINRSALELTAVNASLAGVTNLSAVQSDLLTQVGGQFDLIVANPPYLLDREQRAYRHGGGKLGAGLSIAIVAEAIFRLAPGGSLLLYTGVVMHSNTDPFQKVVEPMLRAAGFTWTYEEIDPDVFGEELNDPAYAFANRIAAIWLCATKPGEATAKLNN